MTNFFFGGDKSGRSITAAPDKIFTQTFFEGIVEGSDFGSFWQILAVPVIGSARKNGSGAKNRENGQMT